MRSIDVDEEPQAYLALGFRGVPATVLVDGEGNYLDSFTGGLPDSELEAKLTQLGY
jgi:thioredoxin-like negative regulator of GroEL